MKRLAILLTMQVMVGMLACAQTLPTFSTDGNETWYIIQFCNGEAALQDMGEGANLQTVAADKTNEAQLWKLVGTQASMELISKAGRHIYYNGSRYAAAKGKTGSLKLVSTSNATYSPAWEIQTAATTGNSMNQWGGAGTGRELGSWSAGDPNNPLLFIEPASLPDSDPEPAKLTEWACTAVAGYQPEHLLTLWYNAPVTRQTVSDPWMEYALPIGNGQMGGMVYGGVRQDIVQFNEKTLWTGSSTVYNRDGGYQNFGCIYMEDTSGRFGTASTKGVKDYVRGLDLETALAYAEWKSTDKSVSYRREYLVSYPDQVLAVRLTASEPGQLSQRIYLWNAHNERATYAEGEGSFGGSLQTVSYNARLRVVATGGSMTTDEQGVHVTDADEIVVYLSATTDYDPIAAGFTSNTDQISLRTKAAVDAAAAKGWRAVKGDHLADYQPLFDRCRLNLAGAVNKAPTNSLVTTYASLTNKTLLTRSAAARMLEMLYFHYGRYLLIASSRGIDLPNNLQGIWNHKNAAPWCSDIHANINIQMNYWPAEPMAMPEMHEKYLNYLYNMAVVQPVWKSYATGSGSDGRYLHHTTGWACYTENNIFGCCTDWMAANYPEAGAWSVDHLWQHYRYTLDREFLKAKALPVMVSATRMWMERLKLAADGTWECPKEYSPEHGPVENATAHSQQIVWNLFDKTLKAIDVLGAEEAGVTNTFVAQLKAKFAKLDNGLHTETYKGAAREGVKTGEEILREWKYTDYATGNGSETGHRHLSHLMALYPFANLPSTDPYYAPAVRSLKLRGLPSTGWSMGWKVNLWARAMEPDQCVELFKQEFKHSTTYRTDQNQGGIYYNLFDSHAPFQIDGNFGVAAGMAEMLLQSHTDTLQLLPALPYCWPAGEVEGLRAVGAFEVGMKWEADTLVSARLHSMKGSKAMVAYKGVSHATVTDAAGNSVVVTVLSADRIEFDTTEGGVYQLSMGQTNGIVMDRSLHSDARQGVSYDLSGRQVERATGRGIVITDGRKAVR